MCLYALSSGRYYNGYLTRIFKDFTMQTSSQITPVILLILDGFGHNEDVADNAIAQARTPNLDALKRTEPHTLINAPRPCLNGPLLSYPFAR